MRLLNFSSYYCIISLENISSVSTNYNTYFSRYVGVHPPYTLFLAILPGVHLVYGPLHSTALSSYLRCKSISTIFIITYLHYSDQPPRTSASPSSPPQRLLDDSPSHQPTPPLLRLPQAVRLQERAPLPFCWPSTRTWTNLVHQNHSSYFLLFSEPNQCLPTALSHLSFSITNTAFISHQHTSRNSVQDFPSWCY